MAWRIRVRKEVTIAMMNPAILMKIMHAKESFVRNHPKFESFVKAVFMGNGGITEGTVIEITVTKPGEQPISSNFRVLASDMELAQQLKKLK